MLFSTPVENENTNHARVNNSDEAATERDMLMDAFDDFSDSDISEEDWDDRRIQPDEHKSREKKSLKNALFGRKSSPSSYIAVHSNNNNISADAAATGSGSSSSTSNINSIQGQTNGSSSQQTNTAFLAPPGSEEAVSLQDLSSSSSLNVASSISESQPLHSAPTTNLASSSSSNNNNRRTSFLSLLPWRRNQVPTTLTTNNQNDGVFNNITAKPETDKDDDQDVPPSYEEAAADATPLYWETVIMAPGYNDEIFIDGLPVGSPINFLWNMIVSAAFQFVGFLLTYLLHTSHAAKHGARAGLGFTLFQYGFYLQPSFSGSAGDGTVKEFQPSQPNDYDVSSNSDSLSGSFHQVISSAVSQATTVAGDAAAKAGDAAAAAAPNKASGWVSYFLMGLGLFLILKSLFDYARARRMEMVIIQSPSNAAAVEQQQAENMV